MVKVSACVIVKNEAENLPEWIACARRIAQEMIVVDTGSEDATVEIARRAGAKVYHFPWTGDFSAAKNHALEQASGSWILFLDADEYFLEEDCRKLRREIERKDRDHSLLGFICPLVNIDKENPKELSAATWQIRVFRNLKNMRYEGRVHEALKHIGEKSKQMQLFEDVTIYHTGYSRKIVAGKLRRNLEILQQEIAQRGKETIDDFYLADIYYGLQDYDLAIEHARAAIDSGARVVGLTNRPYAIYLQCLMMKGVSYEEFDQAATELIAKRSDRAEIYLLAAHGAWRYEYYAAAEQYLQEGVQLYRKEAECSTTEDSLYQEQNAVKIMPWAYGSLAEIAIWKGRLSEAAELLFEALQLRKYDAQAFRRLCRLLSEEELERQIERLYFPRNSMDANFLVQQLRAEGSPLALRYEAHADAGQRLSDYERNFYRGNLKVAAAMAEDALREKLQRALELERRLGLEQSMASLFLPVRG